MESETVASNRANETQERLRNWYIARLRQKALEESGAFNLTPVALIKADRRALERIAAHSQQKGDTVNLQPLIPAKTISTKASIAWITCLWMQCIALGILNQLYAQPWGWGLILSSTAVAAIAMWASISQRQRMQLLISSMQESYKSSAKQNSALSANPKQAPAEAEELLSVLLFRLSKLEEGQRLIADYSNDVQFAFDQDINMICASPSIKKSWGYHPFELLGGKLWQHMSEFNQQQLLAAFAKASAMRGETEVETQIQSALGMDMFIRWSIYWSDTDKTFFVVSTDITAAKKLERVKQEFFAVISHDVRSPVANIVSTLALMEHGLFGALSEDGKKRLRALQATSSYVIELLNDLLELERLESGHFELNFQPIMVDQLLGEARDSISQLAETRNIAVHNAETTNVCLNIDAIKIKRVIINLLSNAIKFSNDNDTIVLQAFLPADGGCSISVTDCGRGISPADQERLFTRFHQVEADDATLRGGIGLGLHSSQAIVLAHGGSLTVTSATGKGSTFTVHLPATVIQQNVEAAAATTIT